MKIQFDTYIVINLLVLLSDASTIGNKYKSSLVDSIHGPAQYSHNALQLWNSLKSHRAPYFQRLAASLLGIMMIMPQNVAIGIDFQGRSTTYKGANNVFQFIYPDELKESQKPLKTHEEEVYLKSESHKGFSVGLTIDPVKISNIKEFTTPKKLAKRVEAVEREKEGVYDVQMIDSTEISLPLEGDETLEAYKIEYSVESSRGNNHYDVVATIKNKRLYVLTAQYSDTDKDSLGPVADKIVESLVIK